MSAPAFTLPPPTGDDLDLGATVDRARLKVGRDLGRRLRDARVALPVRQVLELLEQGDVDELLSPVNAAFFGIGSSLALIFGQTAAATSSSVGVLRGFDDSRFEISRLRELREARILRELVTPSQAWLNAVLAVAFEQGLPELATARLLRDSIGLAAAGVRRVAGFRQALERGSADALQAELRDRRFDPTLERAVAGERALTAAQIGRMTDRYRDRLLAQRVDAIALLESQRAVHSAVDASLEQAVDDGAIDPPQRVWVHRPALSKSPRFRQHGPMNGQRRALGEPFESGDGVELRYPGDPAAPASETIHCNCVVRIV